MKKCLILAIILILVFSSYVSAISINNEKDSTINMQTTDFTHTVFVEECTATWCPKCPFAAEALYSIYQSGDYPFSCKRTDERLYPQFLQNLCISNSVF